MKGIHPAIIWDIERKRRELERDDRPALYVPLPEYEPEPPTREIEYVLEL